MRSHFPEINRSGRTKIPALASGLCAAAVLFSMAARRSRSHAPSKPPGVNPPVPCAGVAVQSRFHQGRRRPAGIDREP